MSAFDALRKFTTAPHIRDSEACGVIARDLRAAVAEHDALRDAVQEYAAARAAWEAYPNGGETASAAKHRLTRAEDALCALAPEVTP